MGYDYDSDVTTFSPEGKIFQIEYANEAIKQGSPLIAICNDKYAVLVAYLRKHDALAYPQEKIFKIHSKCAIGVCGQISDGMSLRKAFLAQNLSYKRSYGTYKPLNALLIDACEKAQDDVRGYGFRPRAVGLLAISCEETPRVFEFKPEGLSYEYTAYAIGHRSQSARSLLETSGSFNGMELEELVKTAINALRSTIPENEELNKETCYVVGMGTEMEYTVIDSAGYL